MPEVGISKVRSKRVCSGWLNRADRRVAKVWSPKPRERRLRCSDERWFGSGEEGGARRGDKSGMRGGDEERLRCTQGRGMSGGE